MSKVSKYSVRALREPAQLFFWFFPPGPTGSEDSLTIWTNGGPGCSSLEGALQENGVRDFVFGPTRVVVLRIKISAFFFTQPVSWGYGQYKPTMNEYSWTNLSSMLYIEQPVGTGFTQGTPNIQDEDDLAEQFVGFLQQFLEVFSELKGKKTYIAGESVRLRSSFLLVISTNTKYLWVLRSMPGCTFPVSTKSNPFGVIIDIELPQISPIIFTRMRPLICRCREFGSPTVGDILRAILPYV